MHGNPYYQCDYEEEPRVVTCNNAVCGENAECGQSGRVFKCTCIKGYQGDPLIGCYPECRVNSDCGSSRKACQNSKCVDVCSEGVCGINSRCEAKNHRAICKSFLYDLFHFANERFSS